MARWRGLPSLRDRRQCHEAPDHRRGHVNGKRQARIGLWKCKEKECRKQFTVKVGTMLSSMAVSRCIRCFRRSICFAALKRAFPRTSSTAFLGLPTRPLGSSRTASARPCETVTFTPTGRRAAWPLRFDETHIRSAAGVTAKANLSSRSSMAAGAIATCRAYRAGGIIDGGGGHRSFPR